MNYNNDNYVYDLGPNEFKIDPYFCFAWNYILDVFCVQSGIIEINGSNVVYYHIMLIDAQIQMLLLIVCSPPVRQFMNFGLIQ